MKEVLLFTIFIQLSFSLTAQETCTVKLKEIKGKYTGYCTDGKANGKGKSVGTDQYEGEFKNGYPDGKGMYIWKDGHYFIGYFKEGKKEGKGDMYYESITGMDSVITGFWQKDKYTGEYEKPYVVISNSDGIRKVECSITDTKGDNINITVHQLTGTTNSIASTAVIPFINDINTVTGTFYLTNNQMLSNSSITRILQVTFPFRAIFYLNNSENTEILFNAKGNYDVYIDMQ